MKSSQTIKGSYVNDLACHRKELKRTAISMSTTLNAIALIFKNLQGSRSKVKK